jgi:uncharacterized protein (TIGR03083 family)
MTLNLTLPEHRTAMELAAGEYERCLALLSSLDAEDWQRPTDCPEWSVRQMACHMLGMIAMVTSLREMMRQQLIAQRAGGDPLDALTALQVRERAGWEPARIIDQWSRQAPAAVAGRSRLPGIVRRLPVIHQQMGDEREIWRVGYLTDVILTRDPWLHRVDISRAVGRPDQLSAEHDGAIVDGVVREWAVRHGRSCSLVLDGPAGGSWTFGSGGPASRHDAVEFCRALSGRPSTIEPAAHFETYVPF